MDGNFSKNRARMLVFCDPEEGGVRLVSLVEIFWLARKVRAWERKLRKMVSSPKTTLNPLKRFLKELEKENLKKKVGQFIDPTFFLEV